MVSIADLSGASQRLLTTAADQAARASGLVRRRGRVTGATFVQTCVCGWLARPAASLSQLAQVAATGGLVSGPPGPDQRFTAEAAACLKRVLDAARREVVAAEPVALPRRGRSNGVWRWDSTTGARAAAGGWRRTRGRG